MRLSERSVSSFGVSKLFDHLGGHNKVEEIYYGEITDTHYAGFGSCFKIIKSDDVVFAIRESVESIQTTSVFGPFPLEPVEKALSVLKRIILALKLQGSGVKKVSEDAETDTHLITVSVVPSSGSKLLYAYLATNAYSMVWNERNEETRQIYKIGIAISEK